ncbi:MAG: hypothetical protein ABI039_12035 [Vicinamibacterales bacterium]
MDAAKMIDRDLHQPARDLIGRSALARRASNMSRTIELAGTRSRTFHAVAVFAGGWRSLGGGQRRRALGVMLITAAVIHAAMTVLHHLPAGWMWLAVPAIAVAEGVVLLAASGSSPADPS